MCMRLINFYLLSRMPTNTNTEKKTRKQYTRRTAKEKLSEKIGRIESALNDIRSMVDMHCGEQVIKTARAAGAAAADEVLMSLKPAMFTPSAAAAPVPATAAVAKKAPRSKTVRPAPAPAVQTEPVAPLEPGEDADVEGAEGEPVQVPAVVPPKAKKPGPDLWNQFLRNYISNQEAKGRKITRLQAMSEAGPNYRAKYQLPEPKPRAKTAKVPKNLGGVQVAPVEKPVVTNARKSRKVKVMAPGNLAPVTPGRVSPPRPIAAPELLPLPTAASAPAPTAAPAKTPGFFENLTSTFTAKPANIVNAVNPFNTPTPAPANNNSARPSPSEYSYNNLGKNANNPARKIMVEDQEYYMSNANRGLYRRSGTNTGEWVGYLEPGGVIRYTNQPNA